MKVLCLISGGIDSPVAAALALRGGAELVCVNFINAPFGSEENVDKVKALVQKIAENKELAKGKIKKIKLILVPFGSTVQKEIAAKGERKFQCVLCRRMMLRTAEIIAREEGCEALLTGESLGQVASQTLDNLTTSATAVEIPILRPLLGMDKLEIEKLSREFGLYAESTKPVACCTLVPDQPATKSTRGVLEKEEEKIGAKGLARKAVKGKEVILIGGE
ncbi:MAG: 7-cyano-7-deazaguanine synthase [Candidatus Diapherotrites archaeon]|nr:7-cyano-7-deazaguanine synthase [Candidatus Micrarchaeota archaeon]